jgi:tetratricopeptide (TPR) repeat protein
MRKYTVPSVIVCLAAVVSFSLGVRPACGQEDYKAKYEKLQKEYGIVSVDRDNLLSQIKNLSTLESRFRAADNEMKKANEAKDAALKDAQQARDRAAELSGKVSSFDAENAGLVKERDDIKKALEKMNLDFKIVPETQKENARLKADNSSMQRDLKNLQVKSKRLEEQQLNDSAQLEIYRRQIKEFKRRYEQAMAKNRMLEKKIEQIPAKFAEIARENKVLIKETALMHYNLGVFYTKNKEYSRAIAEFEKDLELNPDDGAAHYNLGFIYAEYLVNRPMALAHFRKFLSLVKSEDKDVDWVRKYILTWQTWEGKKPID